MTTATPPTQPPAGPGARAALVGPAVRTALLATLALGAVVTAAAAAVGGGAAAAGAAVGVGMVCVFFGFGAVVLNVVAAVLPALSLLVAMLTYTLQVVLLGVVFLALSRSGALGSSLDGGWVGGTVIAGTMAWTAAQVYGHVHTRQPLYDLRPGREQASAR